MKKGIFCPIHLISNLSPLNIGITKIPIFLTEKYQYTHFIYLFI